MSDSAATPEMGDISVAERAEVARELTGFWWVQLVLGIAWIVAALAILQFDQASITTIGIIVGIMFIVAGMEQFVLAAVADSLRWLWGLFGVLSSSPE